MLDLQNKWLRNCTTVKDMATAICREQFYDTLPMDVRTWVQDKKPNTSQKAGELADEYVQTRQTSNTPGSRSHSRPLVNQKCCFVCNQLEHFAKDCPLNKPDDNTKEEKKENLNGETVKGKGNGGKKSRGEQNNVNNDFYCTYVLHKYDIFM